MSDASDPLPFALASVAGAVLLAGLVGGVAAFALDAPVHLHGGRTTAEPVPASEVRMTADGFAPEAVRVAPGETVTWRNEDTAPHTVTGEAPQLESGLLGAGASWSWTSDAPGEYYYHCHVHPEMLGLVVVG